MNPAEFVLDDDWLKFSPSEWSFLGGETTRETKLSEERDTEALLALDDWKIEPVQKILHIIIFVSNLQRLKTFVWKSAFGAAQHSSSGLTDSEKGCHTWELCHKPFCVWFGDLNSRTSEFQLYSPNICVLCYLFVFGLKRETVTLCCEQSNVVCRLAPWGSTHCVRSHTKNVLSLCSILLLLMEFLSDFWVGGKETSLV